jgi:hypothetical protein
MTPDFAFKAEARDLPPERASSTGPASAGERPGTEDRADQRHCESHDGAEPAAAAADGAAIGDTHSTPDHAHQPRHQGHRCGASPAAGHRTDDHAGQAHYQAEEGLGSPSGDTSGCKRNNDAQHPHS